MRRRSAALERSWLTAAEARDRFGPSLEGSVLDRFADVVRRERAFHLTITDHVVDLPGVDDERTEPLFPEGGSR